MVLPWQPRPRPACREAKKGHFLLIFVASIKHTEKLNKVSFFAIFGEAFVSREVLQLILIDGNVDYRKSIFQADVCFAGDITLY